VNLAAAFLKFFLPDAPAVNASLSKGKTHERQANRPVALKVPDIKADTASIVIPLKRIGKLFLIEATVDGETGNLVFDTGASGLVLNSTYFRDHVSFGQNTSGGITGSLGTEEKVTVDKLDLGTIKYKKVSATLSNLGHIENRRGVKVLGLFGFELIRSYEIRIDYSNNTLTLLPTDRKGNLLNPSAIFTPDYLQKVDFLHNIMFMKAEVGGKMLRFCFDTGAETNVLSTDLPDDVLETVSITRTSKLRGAGQTTTEVFYGVMNSFQIGDTAFQQMETIITYLDHLNESYGTHLDGVVGFDFISKGTFCINFVKNQMGIMYFKNREQ
jgi:predicted aspartyl protease